MATEEQELNLVLISLADLGFNEPVRRLRQIYERATGFGLGLCPLEVGPHLRLQYKNQPEGEHLWIAMEPIGTNRDLFTVGCHNSMLYLSCSNGHDRPIGGGTQWYPDSLFVFVCPPQKECKMRSIVELLRKHGINVGIGDFLWR